MPPSAPLLTRRGLLRGATAAGLLGTVGALGCAFGGGSARPGPRPGPRPGSATDTAWTLQPRPLPEGFVRGMNLAHLHHRGYGYGSDRALAQVRRLKGLGLTSIAVNPFAYTRSLTSPEIHWGGDASLTDDDLRRQVDQAHAEGLAVMMKPHLWSWKFLDGSGNGDITLDAAGWREWFARYTEFAVHYATLAAAAGCETLCVGLEYASATRENPGAWAAVARACRTVYGGPLTYAANWWQEYEQFQDWGAFDLIGIDAYFPLSGPDAPRRGGDGGDAADGGGDTSVAALVAAWQPHLDAIERVCGGRPVIFPEAGYRAVVGATDRPWEDRKGAVDPEIQARAYEALLRACTARPWFRGVYWWKWFTDLPGEGDPFVPAGQPAERVMAAWFGGSAG